MLRRRCVVLGVLLASFLTCGLTSSASNALALDVDPPTVGQGSPAFSPNWVASGSYKVVARDTGSGVASFRLVSDNTPAWSVAMPDRGCALDLANPCRASETLSVPVAALRDGPNTITATVTDGAGNSTVSQVGTLQVDRSNPAITSVTGPLASSNAWFDGSPSLSFTHHDGYSGAWQSEIDVSPGVRGRDSFARSVSNGWGGADVGGAWTVKSGDSANFAVDGDRGTISAPSGSTQAIRAYPVPLGSADQDARVDVTLPDSPAVRRFTGSLLLRWSDWTAYRVSLVVSSDGAVLIRGTDRRTGATVFPDADTGLRGAAGDTIRLRVNATGSPTRITARAWKAGTAEPSAWTVSATDGTVGPQTTGGFGVDATQSGSGAVTAAFDNLAVSTTSGFTAVDPQYARNADGTICGASGCPADFTHPFSWDTTAELEGRHQIKLSAMDAVFFPATLTYTVGVDRSRPAVTLSGPLTDRRGGGVPYGDSFALHVDARDGDPASPLTARSGMKSLALSLTDSAGVQRDHWAEEQACPMGSCSLARDWTFDSTAYTPGYYTVTVTATDQMASGERAAAHTTTQSFNLHVFVDNDPPGIALSGAVWEFRQVPDDPENMNMGDSVYGLHVDATDGRDDGDPSHVGSGVKTVDIYLDGAQNDPARMHAEQSCNTGGCGLAMDWSLDASQLSVGDHVVKVTSTDQKGNASETNVTVRKEEPTPPPPRDAVVEESGPNDPPADEAPTEAEKSSASASSAPHTGPGDAPRAARGFYVPNTSGKAAFATGCTMGKEGRTGAAILDFGGPWGSNQTKMVGGRIVSIDAAVNVASQFGRGYRYCLPDHSQLTLNVILGENNSTPSEYVNEASGAAWANAVDRVNNYYKGHSYSDHVHASGGNDIEPGFGAASNARAWATGFSAHTNNPMYNFGSADGCPPTASGSRRRGGTCVNHWSQGDVYSVSWKHNRYPFPEIYYQRQVPQWPAISLLGVNSGQGKMFFPGPVSQYQRDHNSFKPSVAWSELFQALRRNPKTSQNRMNYVTDFQVDQVWGR